MLLNLSSIFQTSPHDCGPTAFRIVCDYFSIAPPPPTSCNIIGVGPDYIEAALRRAGLLVQFGEMTIADLRHHANNERPVICLVNYDGEGHYIVSRGVSRSRVFGVCPTRGRFDMAAADFVAMWNDVSRYGGQYRQFGIAAGRAGGTI